MGFSSGNAASHMTEFEASIAPVDMPKKVHEYNFYQLVELLQKLNRFDPEDDDWERQCQLVFSSNPSLGFSPSDVDCLDLRDDKRVVMRTNFFGLSGAQSPLPGYVVEQLLMEGPEGQKQPFFDFFNNRLISLLYRIWRKYRYFVRFQPDAKDDFSAQLLSLVGLGSSELRGDTPINWCKMLAYSGTLAGRSRSPQVVAGIIAHCFDLKEVRIEQWTRRKVDIDISQQTVIGKDNSTLGVSTIVGESVVDCNGKFTICIGQLSRSRFLDFLPSGKEFEPLCKLVEFILREQMAYDLSLSMADEESQQIVLNKESNIALGWTSFLGQSGSKKNVLIQVRQ
ncbi:type VI secretion system baseplate subunit TssG [Vibrio sp. TBV020]|uniref:type VI secretion system baseplate subunit TssG n=1 Tax=Vibrio sp. TBV020 TaxID=3137398 RepID=UPI0038CD138B